MAQSLVDLLGLKRSNMWLATQIPCAVTILRGWGDSALKYTCLFKLRHLCHLVISLLLLTSLMVYLMAQHSLYSAVREQPTSLKITVRRTRLMQCSAR